MSEEKNINDSAQNLSSLYGYPLSEAQNDVRQPYAPPSGGKRPGGRGAGFVACMLALSLAGGAAGGAAATWYLDGRSAEAVPAQQSQYLPETADSLQPALPTAALAQAGDIAAIAEKAAPSVVEIQLKDTMTTFFGRQDRTSAGSGVIYSRDGYIITNNHVVEQGGEVTVRLSDGSEYEASLVGADSKTDLAVIKIDAEGLVPVTFADSDAVKVGQLAVAIGNPLGNLGGTVTEGVISAKDREITIGGESMTLMQTSAAVNPGNSGGGLFDADGNLIGVVNAKSSGLEVEGLGFAIPSGTVLSVARDLIETGYVTGRPEIGIRVVLADDPRSMNYYGVSEPGVYVVETLRSNGLKEGDLIVSIDGAKIETPTDVSEAVASSNVGSSLRFEIMRDGESMELDVPVAEQIPESLRAELAVPTGEI